MRRVAVQFPIVVYPSEHGDIGAYTAHCLNLDILADGETVKEAAILLLELIEEHLVASEQYGADPFRPAPQEYWERLGRAKAIDSRLAAQIVGEANSRVHREQADRLDLSQIEVREFQPA